MNNTEFYVPREDWPQQPDEKCTLEQIKDSTQSKKAKSSSTSRAKKQMSESLAGVTAAAVSVVMLTSSIPILPGLEEIVIDIPDYGKSETCLVCQQEECPYFDRGYAGLRLSLEDDYNTTIAYMEDPNDSYDLNNPDDRDYLYDQFDLEDSDALYDLGDLGELDDTGELDALLDSILDALPGVLDDSDALSNTLDDVYDTTNGTYDDFQTMQGYRPYHARTDVDAPIACVETDNGQRCVLRLDNAFTSDLHSGNWNVLTWQTIHSFDSADFSYSGLFFPLAKAESFPANYTTYEDSLSYTTDYIYVAISYDQTGENRHVDPYTYLDYIGYLDVTTRTYNWSIRDIPGVPNAQIQLVSTLDINEFYELWEYCNVTVIDTKDQVFDLGKTMRFAETDSVYRTYYEHETMGLIRSYSFFEGVSGDFYHSFSYRFPFKSYSIGTYRNIYLSDAGWDNILDLAFDLNQKAPETGHEVFFPAVELNPCTVNDITYRCYLIYHEETYYNTYDALCFMVPQQEMEVAVQFEASLSAEQLENLLDTRDPATAFEISELLNQITLR